MLVIVRRWRPLLSFAGASLLLAACGSEPTTPVTYEFTDVASVAERAKTDGAEAAYQLLRDGDATLDEYTQAVSDERACLEAKGLTATEALVNPVDGWRLGFDIQYNTVSPDAVSAIMTDCHETTQYIALAYEISHEAVMHSDLMAAVRGCLGEANVSITGDELNVEALLAGQPSESPRAQAISRCVLREGVSLFPDRDITVTLP